MKFNALKMLLNLNVFSLLALGTFWGFGEKDRLDVRSR
jgi:hypothetical protein